MSQFERNKKVEAVDTNANPTRKGRGLGLPQGSRASPCLTASSLLSLENSFTPKAVPRGYQPASGVNQKERQRFLKVEVVETSPSSLLPPLLLSFFLLCYQEGWKGVVESCKWIDLFVVGGGGGEMDGGWRELTGEERRE